MRSLGLDIGERRIGVALSDPAGILAIPLTVIFVSNEEDILENIVKLVNHHKVERVVVGLPRSLDGSLGKEGKKVQDVILKLSHHLGIPVEPWDERFSTLAAEQLMREAGLKRDKRKAHVDAMAATLILQGYLDRLRLHNQ